MPEPAGPPSLADTSAALERGDLTCAALTARALDEAERVAADFGAFVTVTRDLAEQAAAEADAERARGHHRGPLHGVPVALKDNIAVAGVGLTGGSRALHGHVADDDAAVVRRLREAGAVIIGKTALDEFAFATVGDGITNPVAPRFTAGGSSGGSAAAVAAGVCALALGTDTGGSVRIPAACCGLVGFKPTHGWMDTTGILPLSWTLDHVGVLTGDVASAALGYAALGGRIGPGRDRESASLRFGIPPPAFMEAAREEVREALDATVDLLEGSGAHVQEVDIPSSDLGISLQYLIVLPESAAYHLTLGTDRTRYTTGVQGAIEWGLSVPARHYVDAQRARSRLHRELDRSLGRVDALLLPTMPITVPERGQMEAALGDGRHEDVVSAMLRFTCLFNHAGFPAVSLPLRERSPEPMGLQLVGRFGGDSDLLNVAGVVEHVLKSA